MKSAGAVGEVVGWGRNTAHLEQALALGVIDRYEADLGAALDGADVVVVAVPVVVVEAVPLAESPGRILAEAVASDLDLPGFAFLGSQQPFGEAIR